jgi:hypothetical protein
MKLKVEDKLIGQFYFLYFISQCKTHRIELRSRQKFFKKKILHLFLFTSLKKNIIIFLHFISHQSFIIII